MSTDDELAEEARKWDNRELTPAGWETVPASQPAACDHEKVYSNSVLTCYPPIRQWICRKCGGLGQEQDEIEQGESYDDLMRKFHP